MLTRKLYIPFSLAALVFLYLAWEKSPDFYWPLLGCVATLVVVYMLSPQIDWWWYQKHPPDLSPVFRQVLQSRISFYNNLSLNDKLKFRHRAALYIEANEFIPKGFEEIPPDIKGAIACTAAQLTLGLDDYLLNKFEHIVIYPHPFPSPQFPEHWHSCEHFEEDGAVLFSAEQLMPGFMEPKKYFHIALYEYARIFRSSYPGIEFPETPHHFWTKVEQFSGFNRQIIKKTIGLPDVDESVVSVVMFFTFPEQVKNELPHIYQTLSGIFNQKP
jgi:hypothetical protein